MCLLPWVHTVEGWLTGIAHEMERTSLAIRAEEPSTLLFLRLEQGVANGHRSFFWLLGGTKPGSHGSIDESWRDAEVRYIGVRLDARHRVAHEQRLGQTVSALPIGGQTSVPNLLNLLPRHFRRAQDLLQIPRLLSHVQGTRPRSNIHNAWIISGQQRQEALHDALGTHEVDVDDLGRFRFVHESAPRVVDDGIQLDALGRQRGGCGLDGFVAADVHQHELDGSAVRSRVFLDRLDSSLAAFRVSGSQQHLGAVVLHQLFAER
mmetsp:Transcript_9893/g.27014  ORF Transcript_9893/g.27014 Transcript_9893/m.27014 type:complete len:263 (+) Transcript_9893:118-906(+)